MGLKIQLTLEQHVLNFMSPLHVDYFFSKYIGKFSKT